MSRLVIPTGVPSATSIKSSWTQNPSRPVQEVAIELVGYEAYEKGFPYVSNLIVTDLTRFSVKIQINVYSVTSSVHRVVRVSTLGRRSGFDFELIKRSTSTNISKHTNIDAR